MSLLKNLTSDSSITAEKDSVGGGSRVLDSGLILGTITLAYVTTSQGGAMGLVLGLKADAGEVRPTLWMTSGTAKGCKNFYEKDGEKFYLPGYLLANSLCLLTVGKEISELDTEEKVVNVWSSDAKAEVPTKVNMLMDLLGQKIYAGVIKQTVDKTKKDDAGVYQPTGETREENEIDKFFRARDKMTTAEIRAKAEAATFADTWSEKFTGTVRDKTSKKAANGKAGAPRAPGALLNGAGAGQASAAKSLFA